MPASTRRQARFMRAAANNPEVARRAGIPQSVARDFVEADERKKRRLRRQ